MSALMEFYFSPHSCSLQPESEWHRPPDVSRRHDVTAGGRGGVCWRRSRAAGRRRPELSGREPPRVPAAFTASALCLWVRADPGKGSSVCRRFSSVKWKRSVRLCRTGIVLGLWFWWPRKSCSYKVLRVQLTQACGGTFIGFRIAQNIDFLPGRSEFTIKSFNQEDGTLPACLPACLLHIWRARPSGCSVYCSHRFVWPVCGSKSKPDRLATTQHVSPEPSHSVCVCVLHGWTSAILISGQGVLSGTVLAMPANVKGYCSF